MKSKICSKCKIEKSLSEFHKDKNCSDGYYPSCKECRHIPSPTIIKKKTLENEGLRECSDCKKIKPIIDFWGKRTQCIICRKNFNTKYYLKNKNSILNQMKENHKNEPWILIYRWIKDRCENPRKQNYYTYGGRGIKCLITEDDINFLYKRDKAHLMKKPSIDRIDNDGDYCLENCRIIELSENTSKSGFERKRKTILQFDLNGNFIREWDKQILAARMLKINKSCISACLKLRQVSAGGFIWKYKEII